MCADTFKVSEVKGHADEFMVSNGEVRALCISQLRQTSVDCHNLKPLLVPAGRSFGFVDNGTL